MSNTLSADGDEAFDDLGGRRQRIVLDGVPEPTRQLVPAQVVPHVPVVDAVGARLEQKLAEPSVPSLMELR